MYQVLCGPDTCRAFDIPARWYIALSLQLAVYGGSVRAYVHCRHGSVLTFSRIAGKKAQCEGEGGGTEGCRGVKRYSLLCNILV